MPLDEKGRKKRASEAGKASGKVRSEGKKERDAYICLAFTYLSGCPLTKQDTNKALKFLLEKGADIDTVLMVAPDQTPYRILADCTRLTRQRIDQIVKKAKKPN